MTSIAWHSHKYHVAEIGDDKYYIKMFRTMRIIPFAGMRQPTPKGAMLGYDLRLLVLYEGSAAINHGFYITSEDREIYHGVTDQQGLAVGIPVEPDPNCTCIPFDITCNKTYTCENCKIAYNLRLELPS
jgi:hypothetical protein